MPHTWQWNNMYRVNNIEWSHIIRSAWEYLLSQAYVVQRLKRHRQNSNFFVCLGKLYALRVQYWTLARNHLLSFSLPDVVVVVISLYKRCIHIANAWMIRRARWQTLLGCYLMNVDAVYICIATKSYRMFLLYNINKYGKKKSSSSSSSSSQQASRCTYIQQQTEHHREKHENDKKEEEKIK